jgi:hypothetical protein
MLVGPLPKPRGKPSVRAARAIELYRRASALDWRNPRRRVLNHRLDRVLDVLTIQELASYYSAIRQIRGAE